MRANQHLNQKVNQVVKPMLMALHCEDIQRSTILGKQTAAVEVGVQRSVVCREVVCIIVWGGVKPDDRCGPFQPRPLCVSMIVRGFQKTLWTFLAIK